ncbi:hypothetical protein MMC14_000936 [Varicellaria rhodocarpa]|nr:hypothetical protein [Varicellaria rhodocarpa]
MTPLTKSRPTQLQHLQHFKATAPLASGAAVVVPAGCEEVAFKPESANSVGVVTAEASVGLGLAPVSVAELEEKEEGAVAMMTREEEMAATVEVAAGEREERSEAAAPEEPTTAS